MPCAQSWTVFSKLEFLCTRDPGQLHHGAELRQHIGNTILKTVIISILRLYKRLISPFLGSHCRFTPSCSAYAILAYEKFGPLKATRLVVCRLLKCHPFHPGGYDPI